MFPKGFYVGGINSGISKNLRKKDLAIFYSESDAVACAMFTSNRIKAAPVLLSEKLINRQKGFRIIVANSGNANACTGEKGLKDAKSICKEAGKAFNVNENKILIASTGIIGRFIPVEKIAVGVNKIALDIKNKKNMPFDAAKAIMTTDTVYKIAQRQFKVCGKTVNIWGCAKGAGMIHPDLKLPHATMLTFILTDANIQRKILCKSLKIAVDKSFNRISVDGDTSTNDSVFILANGLAENRSIKTIDADFNIFLENLKEICIDLAKMIIKDAEGSKKFVEIEILNARNEEQARRIASCVATSPLVKTAMFGNDPNWGRIMAAIGRSNADINPNKIDVYFKQIKVAMNGALIKMDEKKLKNILKEKEVKIRIDIKQGKTGLIYYTCDFSYDYIKINADYTT